MHNYCGAQAKAVPITTIGFIEAKDIHGLDQHRAGLLGFPYLSAGIISKGKQPSSPLLRKKQDPVALQDGP
jgi:hypothetical protein